MSNELKLFKHEKFGQLEIYVDSEGREWFPATELAQMLGYKNPQKAIRDHCKEAGCTIRSVRYVQNWLYLMNSKLCRLDLWCQKFWGTLKNELSSILND